ncbi:MAG: Arm DNA-binding domain-containing protein [Clostridia bacterium]|nr:Arm DNA-binding domain-containing protein [Clostridia bacterium]
MAAFKDKKNGSWYVQFRYTDWKGERQQKFKRGFATKKEAQAWEREFLMQKQADVNMTFESFAELYEKDVKPNVFTHNSDLKKRLKAFAKKYPKLCRMIDDDGIGGMAFEVDRKRFGFRLTAPYTAERKKAASELAKKRGMGGNMV